MYYEASREELSNITVPCEIVQCAHKCPKSMHRCNINQYYEDIVQALLLAANRSVVRISMNSLKPYLEDHLDHPRKGRKPEIRHLTSHKHGNSRPSVVWIEFNFLIRR